MVFQMLALGPKLSQSQDEFNPDPVASLKIPVAPAVPIVDGAAMLCRVFGVAEISWDSVFCPVPAEVAAAG